MVSVQIWTHGQYTTCWKVLHHHVHPAYCILGPADSRDQEGREGPHAPLDGADGCSAAGSSHVRHVVDLWLLHLPGRSIRSLGGLRLARLQHLLLVGGQEPLQERQVVPES